MNTTSTGLITVLPAPSSFLPSSSELHAMLEFAETLLKSGLLPAHIKTPQAAFMIIQKGRELGVPPLYALSNITVIQGKPTANAEMLQALIYRDHGDEALRFTETTAERATIRYRRRGWGVPETFSFSLDDAKRAGLLSNPTWQKYPQAMLRARCISAVARASFADSIGGMYTAEELGAPVQVNADGDVSIEATPVVESGAGTRTQAAPLSEDVLPATPRMYEILHQLVSEARSLGADQEEDVEPGLTIGEARRRKAYLVDLLSELHNQQLPPVESGTGDIIL